MIRINKRMVIMKRRLIMVAVILAMMMPMMKTMLVIYKDSDLNYTLRLSKCFEYGVQKNYKIAFRMIGSRGLKFKL